MFVWCFCALQWRDVQSVPQKARHKIQKARLFLEGSAPRPLDPRVRRYVSASVNAAGSTCDGTVNAFAFEGTRATKVVFRKAWLKMTIQWTTPMMLTWTVLICLFTRNRPSTTSLIASMLSRAMCMNARRVWRGITACRCMERNVRGVTTRYVRRVWWLTRIPFCDFG